MNSMRNFINVCLTGALTMACFCLTAATSRGDIMTRLNRGENLTIVAIGTSLTNADHSSWFGHMGTWLNSVLYKKNAQRKAH